MQNLVGWRVFNGFKELHEAYSILAPALTLRTVFDARRDLQETFPEVQRNGNYRRLLEWAVEHGVSYDGSNHLLKPYSHGYTSYLKHGTATEQ